MDKQKILSTRKWCIETIVRPYGFLVVPTWTCGGQSPELEGKKPIVQDWTNLEAIKPMQEKWIEQFLCGEKNLAIICGTGKPGAFLMVADFDSEAMWEKIGKRISGTTLDILSGKTYDGNFLNGEKRRHQLYFLVPNQIKGFPLHPDNRKDISFDLQGLGRCILAPGSVNQLSGKMYELCPDHMEMPIAFWNGKDIVADFNDQIFQELEYVHSKKQAINISAILMGLKEGQGRDNAAIQLATYYRQQGKSYEECVQLLKDWDKRNQPPLGPEIIEAKVESAFSYDEPLHLEFCDDEVYTDEELEKAQWYLDHPGEIFHLWREATMEHLGDDKSMITGIVLRLANISNRILGSSSSGKSHMADTICKCFPKSWVTKITSGSSNSIRYMGKYIPCLYIAEERGMQNGQQTKGAAGESNMMLDIKMAITEGVIRHNVVEKDEKGHYVTVCHETKVDCFILTTTDIGGQSIEYTNRLIETTTDESEDQTRRINAAKAKARSQFKDQKVDPEPLFRLSRCLTQRLKKENMNYEVVIPWIDALTPIFNADASASCRRYFDKMDKILVAVTQIMAHDCLHVTRADGTEYLIPSPEICWYAWQIANDAIFMQMDDMKGREKLVWTAIQEMFKPNPKKLITKSTMMNYFKKNIKVFSLSEYAQALKDLTAKNYIILDYQGSEECYKLGFMVNPQIDDDITMRMLEQETEQWYKGDGKGVSAVKKIRLIHPITGKEHTYDVNYKFTQTLQVTSAKESPTINDEIAKADGKVGIGALQ